MKKSLFALLIVCLSLFTFGLTTAQEPTTPDSVLTTEDCEILFEYTSAIYMGMVFVPETTGSCQDEYNSAQKLLMLGSNNHYGLVYSGPIYVYKMHRSGFDLLEWISEASLTDLTEKEFTGPVYSMGIDEFGNGYYVIELVELGVGIYGLAPFDTSKTTAQDALSIYKHVRAVLSVYTTSLPVIYIDQYAAEPLLQSLLQ